MNRVGNLAGSIPAFANATLRIEGVVKWFSLIDVLIQMAGRAELDRLKIKWRLCTGLMPKENKGISGWVAGLIGLGIATAVSAVLYKGIVEPSMNEQREANRISWQRIAELEARVHEQDRYQSQNEYEHQILRQELSEMKKQNLSPEMKSKIELLLKNLDPNKKSAN